MDPVVIATPPQNSSGCHICCRKLLLYILDFEEIKELFLYVHITEALKLEPLDAR
jgi:hypothetical protein